MKRLCFLITALLILPLSTEADTACKFPRGFAGGEGVLLHTGSTQWNSLDSAFRQNQMANVYGSVSLNCWMGQTITFKSEINGEYLLHRHQPGSLQDGRREGKIFFNQATLSWAARDNLFIDTGKIRRRYGYLYTVSPLDLLRNPHGAFRSVHVNAAGDSWPAFYDEGSWGFSASAFTPTGSWDAVALPGLTHENNTLKTTGRDASLERTNSQARYLLSYSTTGLNDTTTTISLLAGTQKRLAAGGNYLLNDSWAFNLEAGLIKGQSWRHLTPQASKGLYSWDTNASSAPFVRSSQGINGEISAGVRYSSSQQIESGLEYYGQSQGYSRSAWQQLSRDVAYATDGFNHPANWITSLPQVRDAFRYYSHIMAAEIDRTGRLGALQGKHYLTLFSSRNRSETGVMNWRSSVTVNLIDFSSLASVQLSSPVRENLEMYAGANYALGNAAGEFSLFGEKDVHYAGIRYYW